MPCRTKTSTSGEEHPSEHPRVRTGHTSAGGSESVLEVSEKCTERVVPWTRGCSYEHLRILVDDVDTMELLFEAPSNHFQRTNVSKTHSAQEGRRRGERHCHWCARSDDSSHEHWRDSSPKISRRSAPPAFGRRRFHQKKKTLIFFVLLCLPASFLTFGKVNPGSPQSAFVLARRPS